MKSPTRRHRKGAVSHTLRRTAKLGSNHLQTKSKSNQDARTKSSKRIFESILRLQLQVGHDLHEDLCQRLAAVTMLSEVLESKLSDKSLSEAAEAGRIGKIIAQAIVQTKLLAKRLYAVKSVSTTNHFRYRRH